MAGHFQDGPDFGPNGVGCVFPWSGSSRRVSELGGRVEWRTELLGIKEEGNGWRRPCGRMSANMRCAAPVAAIDPKISMWPSGKDAPDSRQLSGADGGALRETRSSDDTRPPCAIDSRQFSHLGPLPDGAPSRIPVGSAQPLSATAAART